MQLELTHAILLLGPIVKVVTPRVTWLRVRARVRVRVRGKG